MSRIPRVASEVKPEGEFVFFNEGGEWYEEVYGDQYEMASEAYDVAKKAGINILSDKDLETAYVIDGRVVGALFTGFHSDEYSFDVAVDPEFQGKGIGKSLTEMGIEGFDQYDMDGEASISLDVVSPKMEDILSKRGFEVYYEEDGHKLMRKQN